MAASTESPESRFAAQDLGTVHIQAPTMQGSRAARDRRRVPFGRPALLHRMDDVLSLGGAGLQGPGPGEPAGKQDTDADAEPTVMSLAVANGGRRSPRGSDRKSPRAHAPRSNQGPSQGPSPSPSTGPNLFADRRIPSARPRTEEAAADGSAEDRSPNHHAGPSRRRKRGRGRGRSRLSVIVYAVVAVLVAAGAAAFAATRQPAGGSTSAAGAAAAQRHHDRTDRSHGGPALPTGLAEPSAGAAITPPAAGGPSAVGPAPSGPQPIGWWALNSASGMTAADNVEYHNGVAENIDWVGGAAGFDGANSQVEVPEPVVDTGPGSSFTVAAWVDLTSDSGFATAVSQDTIVDSGFYLEYDQTDNCWAFTRRGSDTADSPVDRATASGPPALNTWTALIGVFDGTTGQLQIYVNGQLQGVAADATPFASAGDLVIGRSVTGGVDNAYFPGLIGDVQVFNQALTQPEAESLSGY